MALDSIKTDSKLGKTVKDYLVLKGVETPLKDDVSDTDKDKISDIEHHVSAIMNILDLDLNDDSLKDTPKRVAKMYVKEIFWGLDYDNFPKATVVDNKFSYDEFVIEKDISIKSMCEHHLVPIYGKAIIAYKPSSKVLGLSKLNRIAEFFSRRPQVQERLTEQIFYALSFILDTDDIAVIINAEHFCVKLRGVEDDSSSTITSKLGGIFKSSPEARAEIMSLVRG